MFNNPFSSFHNTVAEAKKEREQLDRLLTISMPRERLLVVAVALVLCILAMWLFLGNVARSLALDGVLVESVENPLAGNRSVQALVWLEGEAAQRIEAGMSAVIKLDSSGGKVDALAGEITAISAVPLLGELAGHAAAVLSMQRIDIALAENADPASLAGNCRIIIALGRQSPISLLRMKRS